VLSGPWLKMHSLSFQNSRIHNLKSEQHAEKEGSYRIQINKDMAVNERRAKTGNIKVGGLKETKTAFLRCTVDAEGLLGWNGHLPLPLSM